MKNITNKDLRVLILACTVSLFASATIFKGLLGLIVNLVK